ncbi:Peptidyl-tRNA hydrolase [Anaerobiospirillum thomasii]|uniref:aminoacyl-tRNA hydrolase n=1 Tax=Anaerobiospirillum thomasii TaxID=179995 RepID=UPI000D8BF5B2|nr:aminoacyl-tRNA hydrolase [Anaerobiospirillum thomasii]SPT71904.1 Peptidyl-tRNA hydrolase [Anaerobiospirillum thomasii]
MATNKSNIRLIAGLGNPGDRYEHTMHNIGLDALYMLCDKYKINMAPDSKFSGLVGRGEIEGCEVRVVFPTTFMNESGRSVGALCNFFKIAPEELLVLHDDLDLAPGTLKLKFGGGLAGHNGLKSISACLGGSQNYYRLRIGIGKPVNRDVVNYVLSRPDPQSRDLIEQSLVGAVHGLSVLFKQGLDRGTSVINGFKPLKEK